MNLVPPPLPPQDFLNSPNVDLYKIGENMILVGCRNLIEAIDVQIKEINKDKSAEINNDRYS